MNDASKPLFSYDTPQAAADQQFGRLLSRDADVLTGYRLGCVAITDREIMGLSGNALQSARNVNEHHARCAAGKMSWMAKGEREAVDAYESGKYLR